LLEAKEHISSHPRGVVLRKTGLIGPGKGIDHSIVGSPRHFPLESLAACQAARVSPGDAIHYFDGARPAVNGIAQIVEAALRRNGIKRLTLKWIGSIGNVIPIGRSHPKPAGIVHFKRPPNPLPVRIGKTGKANERDLACLPRSRSRRVLNLAVTLGIVPLPEKFFFGSPCLVPVETIKTWLGGPQY
jgi:hypothetical protein